MKSGANSVASYTYDYVGNRDVTTLGNGTSTEYDYDTDPRYRLDMMTHKKGATTLATIGYTATARDNAGNPKSMTDWTGTWDYGYDDNNRLISATPPNPVPGQPAGGDYGYDWVGNRLNPPTGSNHMVCNKADQLTSWPGMHTYTYYGDGSQHEVKTGGTTTTSYTYTPDGLLDEATYNGRTLTNTWDADKNRVSFAAGSTTHTFVYDTTAGIPAVIQEDGVYYVREPGGGLIVRLSGSDTSYYHFDALGSTRLLTDTDGDVTDKYAYDAYGSLISHDELADSIDHPYQYVGELGYYTHYQEPEFRLMQLGVRFYDAEMGRFTQHGSPYTYANNSPTRIVVASGTGNKVNPKEKEADIGEIGWFATACAGATRHGAIRKVKNAYPGKDIFGDNMENAVLHCTWTCMIAAACGRDSSVAVTNNHEKYNWNPKTGPMDLANNGEGLGCWDDMPKPGCSIMTTGPDYPSKCLECCMKKRNGGNLHLPPKDPVPDYPGGNK